MYKAVLKNLRKQSSKLRKRRQAQAGFTLLELLLSVGVTSLIVIGIYQIAEDSVLTTVNRNEAAYYKKVHEAAVSYVKTNFDEIWVTGLGEVTDPALPLVSNGDSYGIAINNTGAPVPPMYLKDPVKGTLPAVFPDVSPSGRETRIFARDIGFIGGDRALEVYTIMYVANGSSPRPLLGKSLHEVVQILGPRAGVLTFDSPATPGIDESTSFASKFGAWDLPVNDFIANVVAASNVSFAGYEANFNVVGGYVALRDVIKFSDSLGLAYLYRIEVNDDPLFNTMETNLDMNGNIIDTIGTLTADHLIANNLNLALDDAQLTGGNLVPSGAAASFFVDEIFYVDGDAHVAAYAEDNGGGVGCIISGTPGAARTASGTTCRYAGGSLRVRGDKPTAANAPAADVNAFVNNGAGTAGRYSLNVNNLVVQRTASGGASADILDGSVNAFSLEVPNSITVGESFVVETTVDVDESMLTGGIAANTLTTVDDTISNHIQTQSIAANAITGNLSTGRLNAGQLSTEGRINLTGGTGGLRVVQNMEADAADIAAGGMNVNEIFVTNETTSCRTSRYFGQDPSIPDFTYANRTTVGGATYDCSSDDGAQAEKNGGHPGFPP